AGLRVVDRRFGSRRPPEWTTSHSLVKDIRGRSMVQFFARNRGMPPPPLTTPGPTAGGTQNAPTQNATTPGGLQGLTPTAGAVATRQSHRPRMNLFGRT